MISVEPEFVYAVRGEADAVTAMFEAAEARVAQCEARAPRAPFLRMLDADAPDAVEVLHPNHRPRRGPHCRRRWCTACG